jgi:hypothetical protein
VFDSVDELETQIWDHLQQLRFYSKQSWVVPAVTRDGHKIHDVVIVGAGQSGLALAYNLKLRGIRRIVVADDQDQDKPGPWSSFARMEHLRTPKSVGGPECANPLLSFRAWFCSKYSRAEYDSFSFIPLASWCEYLAWYRNVLDIDAVNNTTITDIVWVAEDDCFMLVAATPDADEQRTFYARKVCLATGMTASGRWALPDFLPERVPMEACLCAWQPIDWAKLAGDDVAVIGGGASGFDNAALALNAGCGSVTIFARRPFPETNIFAELWRGRDDSGVFPEEAGCPPADILDPLAAHNATLGDLDRLTLIGALFRHGRCPTTLDYLARVPDVDKMIVFENTPVDDVVYVEDIRKMRVRSKGATFDFDRILFALGTEPALACRPELTSLSDKILTWGGVGAERDQLTLDLAGYPKLSHHFQLQSRTAADYYLANIYSLADMVHITLGLQSVPHVVETVARHISGALYHRQLEQNVDLINTQVGATSNFAGASS